MNLVPIFAAGLNLYFVNVLGGKNTVTSTRYLYYNTLVFN
jgi:hypothetical protein